MFGESFLLVLILVVWSASSLKCYFCKSDYISDYYQDELNIAEIPRCGREPYVTTEKHVLDCDAYWDNYSMVKPSFKNATEAMRLTTKRRPGTEKSANQHYEETTKNHNHSAGKTGGGVEASYEEGMTKQGQGLSEDNSTTANGKKSTQQGNNTRLKEIQKNATGPYPKSFWDFLKRSEEREKNSAKGEATKNVYPYNVTGGPWSIQSVNDRVKPYYCLTIETRGASYPSRICGLRYFVDCPLLIELTSQPLEPSCFIKTCYQCNTDYCNTGKQTTYRWQAVLFLCLFSLI